MRKQHKHHKRVLIIENEKNNNRELRGHDVDQLGRRVSDD